jgi:hypothetical protein
MGRIEFEVSHQACRFLDPTRGFEPVEKITEIRRDPLTGHTSHILDMGFEPERPDVERMVAQARSAFNPFAPDKREEVTPRFLEDVEGIPGGRLSVGEALVVPNLFPYDRYSAVTVLSNADFIPLDGFSEDLLVDAFTHTTSSSPRHSRPTTSRGWRMVSGDTRATTSRTSSEPKRMGNAGWGAKETSRGSRASPHWDISTLSACSKEGCLYST